MATNEHSKIVVGVDGAEPSKEALRFAERQAAHTGATVVAVMAWEYPAIYYAWMPVSDMERFQTAAEEALDKTLAEVFGSDSKVHHRAKVVRGDPSKVLLDVARGADMLVVGDRGHGTFTGALLGSVTDRCVHHATCPVVVVRSPS